MKNKLRFQLLFQNIGEGLNPHATLDVFSGDVQIASLYVNIFCRRHGDSLPTVGDLYCTAADMMDCILKDFAALQYSIEYQESLEP